MNLSELESAARTVCHVAEHMDEMRERARAFHRDFGTGQRGYFTPTEDEAVTALWVSYHKARAALLELIQDIRTQVGQASEETLAEFTVAYGAAVVLIDAARFLRDLFGNDRIVRRKLNEALSRYGIPAGRFDDIQLSLTNPNNALQIRAANAFFDQHHRAIRALAVEEETLRPVVSVIDACGAQLRVETTRYVQVRIDDERRRLQDAIVQGGLLRAMYAIQEWGSRLLSTLSTMPLHVPHLPDIVVSRLRSQVNAGDIFVTRKESALTNYFLPGYWPHVALYIGQDSVIESLRDGVHIRGLDSPLGNDAICIIRPLIGLASIDQGIARARTHVGKPYDFDFDFTRSDRLVCTEVVYRAYEGLDGIQFPLTRRAGRQTLSAEDLLNLALRKERFEVRAVYCPKHSTDWLDDERMVDALRATMECAAI